MIRACPFGEVGVSADVAWSYVTDMSKLDSWWDARLVSAEPAGPMAVGQHIEARANGLRVTLDVLEVDAPSRTVRLFVRLPLGMPNDVIVTGFLTGAIDANTKFDSNDLRSTFPRCTLDALKANVAFVDMLRAFARKKATPAQIGLAWLLAQGRRSYPSPA